MRYPPERKEDTRRKIVDAASRAFRLHGVEGASVSEIMGEAGLTVGGFYRHFESKDELFREALSKAMDETLALVQRQRSPDAGNRSGGAHAGGAGMGARAERSPSAPEERPKELGGREWMERAAAVYLTPQHVELRDGGCPIPGLGAAVGRGDTGTRTGFESSLGQIVDEIQHRIAPDDPASARAQAWGFLTTLVGSLLLARGVLSPEIIEEILKAGRAAAVPAENPRPEPRDPAGSSRPPE